jgi:hypothetical protein
MAAPNPSTASTPGKRCLLWDWTNTRDRAAAIEQLPFGGGGPFVSVANWNAWVPPELKGRLPFRPTVRTPQQIRSEEWAWIRDSAHEVVHFYNEPERQQGLTPADAARDWREFMVGQLRREKGKKIVGPSCASDDGGRKWLREFINLVEAADGGKDNRPDFLGVHYYGTSAAEARAYIQSMHAEFGGLPVVVSEVASISRDAREVEAFTAELANWMDATDWVYEYAFFGCMAHVADDFVSPAAQLMDAEGKFTPLMARLMSEQPMQTSG